MEMQTERVETKGSRLAPGHSRPGKEGGIWKSRKRKRGKGLLGQSVPQRPCGSAREDTEGVCTGGTAAL
jgi:hypothetical protein